MTKIMPGVYPKPNRKGLRPKHNYYKTRKKNITEEAKRGAGTIRSICNTTCTKMNKLRDYHVQITVNIMDFKRNNVRLGEKRSCTSGPEVIKSSMIFFLLMNVKMPVIHL